jgi:hypothetical protein
MKKYVAALLVALGMLLVMAVPAFAQECDGASCEVQPGNTEKARSSVFTPPQERPGFIQRDPTAGGHGPSDPRTGRGKRIDEASP